MALEIGGYCQAPGLKAVQSQQESISYAEQ